MIYTFFIVIGVFLTSVRCNKINGITKEDNDESDDEKLNQALILVDILKSEYVKLLRQNLQLRNGEVTVASDEVEQSTCAANTSLSATEEDSLTNSARSKYNATKTSSYSTENQTSQGLVSPSAAPPLSSVPQHLWFWPNVSLTTNVMPFYDMRMPTQLPFPAYQKPLTVPQGFFRRRAPDYYYYDFPRRRFFDLMVGPLQRRIMTNYRKPVQGPDFRRMDYGNDPFDDVATIQPTQPTTSTATTTTTSSTTAETSTQASSSSTQDTSTTPGTTRVTTVTSTPNTHRTDPPPNPATPNKQQETSVTEAQRSSTKKSPTVADVNTEITKEILKHIVHHSPKLGKVSESGSTTKKYRQLADENEPIDHQVHSELDKELKQDGLVSRKNKKITAISDDLEEESWPVISFRTTLKIFLEKSTRYPIPLPENHAFCYTNPNNALCRTFIK